MCQAELKTKNRLLEKFRVKKKELLNVLLTRMIKNLADYLRNINGTYNFENPDQFEDFGPVILAGDEDKHSKRIKYAIDNPAILNLALTGPMGSGKSTILRTFESNYRQYKYLNISLATFDRKTLDTEKIEHNILKQLFYSVEHKKIPESRFKRIENLRGIKFKTLLFVLWLCSVSYFLDTQLFDALKKTLHLDYYWGIMSFFYGIYFAGYSFALVFAVMRFVLNFKLTKFKFKDFDFDNNQDQKTVNFENEIDEILYFFERNPVEIVFFQDLDRFEESKIFIKLREINSLINNYEPIKKQRKITFIYAVCDDLFKENERAKFFDFIIPVIPVINYTSSSSKLLLKLREDIQNKKLTRDFIDDVSLFLNDYRTIKSIFNEYQIYKSIIGRQLDNYNNLLAMMIYKNIEPTDFDKLNINKGYVYSILENVKELKAESSQKFASRKVLLNSKIEEAGKEMLKDVKELRMLFILKFLELNAIQNGYPFHGFSINGLALRIEEMTADEYFNKFRKEVNISYLYNHYSVQGSSISFSKIEKEMGGIKYEQRLEIVINKQTENLLRLKSELEEIETSQKELDSKKLHEILDNADSAAYFAKYADQNKAVNNLKLLNYLLAGGFINGDYNHYISHFHPGSITKEDNDFLLSQLPSEKPLAFTHKLKELDSLFKRIKPENFSKEAILNFSLIDYLIQNKKTGRLNQVLNLLNKGSNRYLGFIDDYLSYAQEGERAVFFRTLANNWRGMWDYIITRSSFTSEKTETYISYTFSYLDQALISRADQQGTLSDYISGVENLDCFYKSPEIEIALKEFLKKSTVKFEKLIYKAEYKNLFEFIYDHNLYALNEEMIKLFISNFNINNTDISKLKTSNYTTVKNSGKAKLIKYIDENLEHYLDNVFLKLENNFEESQEYLTAILNNEALENRSEIIEHGQFSIEDLSLITSTEIQSELIYHEKIVTDWKNVLAYYKKTDTVDITLVDYLDMEKHYKVLSKQGLITDPDEAVRNGFPKALIKSSISDESFARLADNLPFAYKNINSIHEAGQISSTRVKSMINYRRILLTAENYQFVNEKFKDLLLLLIERNVADFVKDIENYLVDSSLMGEILSSQKIAPELKAAVIANTSVEVLIENDSVLTDVATFLSVHKANNISFSLLDEMISASESIEVKVKLAGEYFDLIEEEDLARVIEKIEEYSKLLEGRRPKVANNASNLKLIEKLEGRLVSTKSMSGNGEYIELFPFKTKK